MRKFFISAIIVLVLILIIINPQNYIAAALNGILLWATYILPCILPFMFFTKLFTSYGDIEILTKPFKNITTKLYNLPPCSAYAFMISALSGYPIGAKITKDLYEECKITRGQAHRLTAICSNSGPMFIVGTIGAGILVCPAAGYVILFSHLFSALINGVLYRKCFLNDNTMFMETNKKTQTASGDAMHSSVFSVLVVGGYICVFSVLSAVLSNIGVSTVVSNFLYNILDIDTNVSLSLINGLLEITNGCAALKNAEVSIATKAVIANFLISFGGLSISFQALSFLNSFKISKKFFFMQKITHAFISMGISIPFCFLLLS